AAQGHGSIGSIVGDAGRAAADGDDPRPAAIAVDDIQGAIQAGGSESANGQGLGADGNAGLNLQGGATGDGDASGGRAGGGSILDVQNALVHIHRARVGTRTRQVEGAGAGFGEGERAAPGGDGATEDGVEVIAPDGQRRAAAGAGDRAGIGQRTERDTVARQI